MSFAAAVERERPFVVELDAFSGPLDLLLHLIREQEIEITDIPIARVADQFLDAVSQLGLDEAANYLEMAAWLLRIKIQMLLPRPFDEESWEDPGGHLQVVGRFVQAQLVDRVEELVGDSRDGDVRYLDLLLTDQMQQQVKWTRERVQLDDERALAFYGSCEAHAGSWTRERGPRE